MTNDLKLEYLRHAYDAAFTALAQEVRSWIALGSGAPECDSAESRVRAAEALYRKRRDALAGYLIRREVERRAYRLWEQSGRPHGTAVRDWTRAEQQIPGSHRLLDCVA